MNLNSHQRGVEENGLEKVAHFLSSACAAAFAISDGLHQSNLHTYISTILFHFFSFCFRPHLTLSQFQSLQTDPLAFTVCQPIPPYLGTKGPPSLAS